MVEGMTIGSAKRIYGFLVLQIIVTLFFPPIGFGSYKLFPCDFTILLGSVAALEYLRRQRSPEFVMILRRVMWAAALCTFIWARGFHRPDAPELYSLLDHSAAKPVAFSPIREAVLAIRLLSWFIGGMTVVYLFKHLERVQRGAGRTVIEGLFRILSLCAALVAGISICCSLFPTCEVLLAATYHYEIPKDVWNGRAFGVFQSPLEGGICMGLLLLILMYRVPRSFGRGLSLLAISLGITCTGTVSSWATIALLGLRQLAIWAKPHKKLTALLIMAFCFSISCFGAFFLNVFLISTKWGGIWARSLLWHEYVHLLASRWDTLLFGIGFHANYVDNSYLWFFTRGGMLGLLTIGTLFSRSVVNSWEQWSESQKTVILFLAITSFFMDTIILRPVVYLVICIVLPWLTVCRKQNEESKPSDHVDLEFAFFPSSLTKRRRAPAREHSQVLGR